MRCHGSLLALAAAVAAVATAHAGLRAADGRISFVRAGVGVVTVDSAGANARVVVRMATAAAPRWSPDGARLAFAGTPPEGGGSRIYVVAADGSGLRALTRPPKGANDSDPDWSPDGRRIVFDRRTPSPIVAGPPPTVLGPQLYVMTADGSGVHVLGDGRSPAWSPDGKLIAYVTERQVGPASFRTVSVMRSDGGGRRKLTLSASQAEDTPDWSPDGRLIVFSDEGRIAVVPRGGGSATPLTAGTLPDEDPSWSPDATRIAFVRTLLTRGAPAHRLLVMRADGSRQRVLVGGRWESLAPDWRPAPRS
jgi:TolB protein